MLSRLPASLFSRATEKALPALLTHIFEAEPAELEHPRYIEKYLSTDTYTGSGTECADYRLGMLELLQ